MTSQYGAPSESSALSQYAGSSQFDATNGMPEPPFGLLAQQDLPPQEDLPPQPHPPTQQLVSIQQGIPPHLGAMFGGPIRFGSLPWAGPPSPGGTQQQLPPSQIPRVLEERYRSMSDDELLANANRIHKKWTRWLIRLWRATRLISEYEFLYVYRMSEARFERIGVGQLKQWVAEIEGAHGLLRQRREGGGGAPVEFMGGMGGTGGIGGSVGGGMGGM